jgi:type IV pilus assembly protein PilV
MKCPRNPYAITKGALGRQAGSTLIEVLVSVVLLSLGVVSAMQLVTVSVKERSVLKYKIAATQAATELAERMRANQLGVRAGLYNDTLSYSEASDLVTDVTITTAPCGSTGCTDAATLVDTDLGIVRYNLQQSLPGAALTVRAQTYTAGANQIKIPNASTIYVAWLEPVTDTQVVDGATTPTLLNQATNGCPNSFTTNASGNVRCLGLSYQP